MDYIALDLETTGLNPKTDEIIEIAIVRFNNDGIIEEWSSLVKPEQEIGAFTTHLTGITNEMVADAPKLDSLKELILEKIGDLPIMGHFIHFDIQFLIEKGFPLEANKALDSCTLLQSLCPKLASYSLEVVAKNLQLIQENAHRALDDVKANIGLFEKMRDDVMAQNEKVQNKILTLCQYPEWEWSAVLQDWIQNPCPPSAGLRLKEGLVAESIPAPKMMPLRTWEAPQAPFLLQNPLLGAPEILAYAETLEGRVALLCPDIALWNHKHEKLKVLKHPNHYVHQERFEQAVAEGKIAIKRLPLALKIALWLEETQSGDKGEIRLFKEEKDFWLSWANQEGEAPSSFYKKALEEAQNFVLMDHYSFLKDRVKKEPLLPQFDHYLVMEMDRWLTTIDYAWKITIRSTTLHSHLEGLKQEFPQDIEVIESLEMKLSMLFHLLKKEMVRYGEQEDRSHQLFVQASHRNTSEWNDIQELARASVATLSTLGEELRQHQNHQSFENYLHFLQKILDVPSAILWMNQSEDEDLIISSFPDKNTELFKEKIWKSPGTFHLFCKQGNLGDDFAFLKKNLALPEDLPCRDASEAHALPLMNAPQRIPNPNEPSNIGVVSDCLASLSQSLEGSIFVLVTAKHSGESLFYSLKDKPELQHVLRVQNMSGSQGKILEMTRQSEKPSMVMGNEHLLRFFIENGLEFQHLMIHRFPFSRPNDPITLARTAPLQNAYTEFALPMAKWKLHTLLHEFLGEDWNGKSIYLLDPRRDMMGL